MALAPKQIAGTLLFVGAAQFMIFIIVAEVLYPNYSISDNYISDLGVGPTATLFGGSAFLCGILILLSAYFCFNSFNDKIFSIPLGIAGLGVAGVGIFPETLLEFHIPFAVMAFLFGPIAILASYRITKPPFSYFSIILGASALLALILLYLRITLGLGVGGMERMIAYPLLIWASSLGGYFLAASEK